MAAGADGRADGRRRSPGPRATAPGRGRQPPRGAEISPGLRLPGIRDATRVLRRHSVTRRRTDGSGSKSSAPELRIMRPLRSPSWTRPHIIFF
ncbi:unnamed protein product [Staurois parvus]|uniref:Uncharacterized protein n=1 Tax=Staurois parvus TaxID=386267 RepID=A0ABN9AD31_9NEOB|nr:unnamed protein product [Staurois parvus]